MYVTEKTIGTSVHISLTKWCIMEYWSDALWDLLDESIVPVPVKLSEKISYKINK